MSDRQQGAADIIVQRAIVNGRIAAMRREQARRVGGGAVTIHVLVTLAVVAALLALVLR